MNPQITKKNKRNNKTKKKKQSRSKWCSFPRAVYGLYVDFCRETSIHGLKHTVAPHLHWFERLLWFVLTVSAFGGAVYCALNQLSRYNSEPVVVSMQRDYRSWWRVFPAVTACFTDRVDPDKAKQQIEMIWNVTEESDPDKYQYYYSFIEFIADISFRTNLQNFWKYQEDDSFKGVNLLLLVFNVHPTYALNLMTSVKNADMQWVPVMTEVGMCMTFNSEYSQYQFIVPDLEWKAHELLSCHYLSGQCFIKVDSTNNALRYFVHSPYEISTAISNPTGEIEPGEELLIDYKGVEIKAASRLRSLRPEQRRCRYADEILSKTVPMAVCAMRMEWPALAATWKYSSICQKTWPNAPACLSVLSSTTTPIQKRSFFASLGGTTALFVGASVLTVVETILFFIRQFMKIMCTNFKKTRVVEFKP